MKRIILIMMIIILCISSQVFSMDIYNIESIIKKKIDINEDINQFIEISGSCIYIPRFTDNRKGLNIKKYLLSTLDLVKDINVTTNSYMNPFINPIIGINNNKIYFLNYSKKELMEINVDSNSISDKIKIENEFNKGSAPSYKSSFIIKDKNIYIINPFIYRKANPIQKYDIKGNLIKEFDTTGSILKLLYKGDNIYYVSNNNLGELNDNLKLMNSYKINEVANNYDFTFYNNQFVAVSDRYLTVYDFKKNSKKRFTLSLIKDNFDEEFLIKSDNDKLYLVNINGNTIYELELSI